jgi:hypothetical protein
MPAAATEARAKAEAARRRGGRPLARSSIRYYVVILHRALKDAIAEAARRTRWLVLVFIASLGYAMALRPGNFSGGVTREVEMTVPPHDKAWNSRHGKQVASMYHEDGHQLGVAPDRINTIIDGVAAQRYGTHADAQTQADSPELWEELAELVAAGKLIMPIQSVNPLEQVRDAYAELAARHTRGKIGLRLAPDE